MKEQIRRLKHCREMLGLSGDSGEFKHFVSDSVATLLNFVKVRKLIMHSMNGNFDSQSAQYKNTVKFTSSVCLMFILSLDGCANI